MQIESSCKFAGKQRARTTQRLFARRERLFASPKSSTTSSSVAPVHPDAVRRRQEAESQALLRAMERQREREAGQKWWEQATNIMPLLNSAREFWEALEQFRDSGKLVVATFFAEDCYACKSLHPKLHKIAASYGNHVVFVKINGSCPGVRDLVEQLGVKHVPWFLFFRGGQCVHSMSASLNPEKLQAFREQLEQLRSA